MRAKLEELIKRNKSLHPFVFKEFETMEDLKIYKKNNSPIFVEYYQNLEQIKKLEWELLTPEEKAREEKLLRFIELKSKGEPFDFDEFL